MQIRVRATGMLIEYLAPFVRDGGEDNEVTLEVTEGATIPEVLRQLAVPDDQPCMVSLGGALVPSAERAATRVAEGDMLVVMSPLKGG